jgi:hypothetical protein
MYRQRYMISTVHFIEVDWKCENSVLATCDDEQCGIKKSVGHVEFYFKFVYMGYVGISLFSSQFWWYVFLLLVELSAVSFCMVTELCFR